MHHETITYDQLQATLDLAGLEMRASEVHGIVCAEICRQLRIGHASDISTLLGVSKPAGGAVQALLQAVDELTEQSRRMLDAGMQFSLLLPDDDEGIDERTESVADWARGFVLALLRGGQLTLKDLNNNSAELIQDMFKISEAQSGAEPEENERALTEIEEYMRVGVQLVFEELQTDGQTRPMEEGAH